MTERQHDGTGWSLAHSLDGASRRAKPKASLSRHLVGHRVALPESAPSNDLYDAQQSPEDAALVARSAQTGEAAWAHERVALIGRALDSEAKRLAADPAKAGSVAGHLAPLIEKAFAGAVSEAPGAHARAIVGREREPLETELLSERAVMSVAAKQRAEREARRAALADELAMLKEQPQRWASAHGRRARSIDDLPLDEGRRNALKGAAARAQANAAAEGLLQQDSSWLLEDLDDPAFAGALGTDDTARWRSEAEAAVARRAERIAAESAERAQLAASDMRATLKRFKDKDDGPLPPRDSVASALGNEAAADAELSAALKGRKQRHAEGAVALMASADETGWIDAAPDKETRTVRELTVATKRAAVAGNAGRWLMRHSATLKELAKAATDDPATLPRLADHYAALRRQVSGRGAVPGDAGADADRNVAALPDAVVADLVEQVLAGETPQARLDTLTTILDGAAGGDGEKFAYAIALDADDLAPADAIAHQLEALGLPSGTATRWPQLTDPRMRRSARLALLGGFAKQIAEEQKILSGDTIAKMQPNSEKDLQSRYQKAGVPLDPETSLNSLEGKYKEAATYMSLRGWDQSAKLLRHYLEGSGLPYEIPAEFLKAHESVKLAENRIKRHFAEWIENPDSANRDSEKIADQLRRLPDGVTMSASATWDADLNPTSEESDLFHSIGRSHLQGAGEIDFRREGNRIVFSGLVTIRLGGDTSGDPYDFSPEFRTGLPEIGFGASGRELNRLVAEGRAKVFDMRSDWLLNISGVLVKEADGFSVEFIQWSDVIN